MEERVTQIIKNRLTANILGVVFVAFIFGYALPRSTYRPAFVFSVTILLEVFFVWSAWVNSRNTQAPSKRYRIFNKWVYLYLRRLLLIGSILDLILDLKRLSPLETLFGHYRPPTSETLGNMVFHASVAGTSLRGIKAAKFVEAYYVDLENKRVGLSENPTSPPAQPPTTSGLGN